MVHLTWKTFRVKKVYRTPGPGFVGADASRPPMPPEGAPIPESRHARGDEESFDWRLAFIRTYLERDTPRFGPRTPAETLRRFWTMLAHNQG